MTTGQNVVVIYESVFGNSRTIAEAIRDGIELTEPTAVVSCLPAGAADAGAVRAADLLVVGGPTHVHGMSRRLSRNMAMTSERNSGHADRIDADADGPGIRDWLHTIADALPGQRAAAFDTRVDIRHAGSAADGIARRLRRHGYRMVAEPASFVVDDTTGPLRDGEFERARAWAATLVAGH